MRATRKQIIDYICTRLQGLYPASECRRIALMAAAEWSGEQESKYLVEPNEIIEIENLEELVVPLAEGTPIQYITGVAEFCGEEFVVRQGVLIPRPETEELVMWALEQTKGIARPRILDICTGSGCIAIALKLRLPNAEVVAIDLSDEALAIAQENSSRLSADVRFIKDDALAGLSAIEGEQFDIIISNPPYIPLSERAQMHTNVKDYEPAMALFVEDDDPLIFYREIAHAGQRLLSENGVLMYEIHQTMGDQTTQMLMQQGYRDIELRHDFRQNPRMICCRRSNL